MRSAASGLGEVLSGGVAAMPAGAGSERQRTKEAERIIGNVQVCPYVAPPSLIPLHMFDVGLVEPVAPHDLGAGASKDPSTSSIRKEGRCAGSSLSAFGSSSMSNGPPLQQLAEKEKCVVQ